MSHFFCNADQYQKMYARSISEPENFWAEQAQQFVTWFKPWKKVLTGSLTGGNVRWFEGAQLNVSVNCLDRHLADRADQTAILWQADTPGQSKKITYRALHEEVCRFANVLKTQGVRKGNRVCIYLPMIPEAAVAMLACTRIGAIHSVVFGGFSSAALRDRILDADCQIVITADGSFRSGKITPLKANVDEALLNCPKVTSVIVVQRTGGKITWQAARDHWYHELTAQASTDCPAEIMDANDPLFILYTSGSTKKPKGVLHGTAGYLTYVACTHHYIFDYHPGEIYWCTADVGWITGHSYVIYGPLANGATSLMYEGVPTYPNNSRCWEMIDEHQVNVFYTAPTAIRSLMSTGDAPVLSTSRKSLRILGSVGEPINPEAWQWYYHVVGENRCPIVDTWWQTETGGIMLSPLPGATHLKPGSATQPFFGIQPALVDEEGQILTGAQSGRLVITRPWPGQMHTIYGDHQRYLDTYLNVVPGVYFTGDGATRDADGDYWITGRIDDIIKVSGHRLATAEIESALLQNSNVVEAAVVGYPHPIKGQGIYVFVVAKVDVVVNKSLTKTLVNDVRQQIGPVATPDKILWVKGLPKTRSGKIMRRILRNIAAGEYEQLGDTSTLADSNVIDEIIQALKEN